MSLSVPDSSLTYQAFVDRVKYWQASTNGELRIACFVSELETEELKESLGKRGYKVRDVGDIFEVLAHYWRRNEQVQVRFYCYYDQRLNILLAFTSDPADAINRTLRDWVKYQRRLYYLWINPKFFVDVSNKILNEHPGTLIPSFNAERFPWSKFQDVARPEFERSFEYHGDDGRFTLEEMSHYYGVLPTAMEFAVPRMARFRMTHEGVFTFRGGNLDFVFDIINEVLSRTLREKQVIGEAKFEFIPVATPTKHLQLINLVPISVKFTRPLSYDESDEIVQALSQHDFELYDLTREAGSLHLSGTVYDKEKRCMIDLTGTADGLTLSPHKDVKFDSIMRLYRTLADYVDVEAKLTPMTPFDSVR